MQGLNQYGLSKRAEAQAGRLRRHQGIEAESEVRRTFSTKAEARNYETNVIERYRKCLGKILCQGTKEIDKCMIHLIEG
jgi:hypothetical protein